MYLCRPLAFLGFFALLAPLIHALSIPGHSTFETPYDDMVVHDSRDAAPRGFVNVGDLANNTVIDLEIGLPGRDMPGLLRRLLEISTPGSPWYGKHMTKEEADSYVRPTDKTVRKVNAWLAYYEVPSKTITSSGNRLRITLPVWKANKMLQATFSTYRHMETGTESFQALSYSLPSQLDKMIESIEPTTSFPNPRSRHSVADDQVYFSPSTLPE